MLEFRNVEITQGNFSLSADFSIPDGSNVGIMGPSGAGKSTLLSVVGGFFAQSRGQVLWDGQPMDRLSPHDRPVANLFQDNNLFPHMTATQNIALGVRPSLKLTTEERERVDAALTTVGLSGMGGRKPSELSGGQQSRVALARVLVQSQPLVLLDEPFSALGPGMRKEMIGLARDVGARLDATVIMVSHDVEDIRDFAELVIWVENGICLPPRPWEELRADPPAGLSRYIGE